MICIDFEYAEHKLSDFGCIICHINSGADGSVDNSNILSYNTLTSGNNKFDLLSSEYNEPLTFTLEIAKNPCGGSRFFTPAEISKIKAWLNRREFLKFSPIYDSEDYPKIYCNGSFNVSTIPYCGNIIGMELKFTSNAPYAYYEPITYSYTITTSNNKFKIYSMSDEVGYAYVNAKIKCSKAGDLQISNSKTETKITEIKNCISGEIITLNGKLKHISSNYQSTNHKTLYNDFNYSFPVIVREHDEINSENTFTVSLPCVIEITYSPICKLGVI